MPASLLSGDPTPARVKAALDVVARHGYLSADKLHAMSPDDWNAIQDWAREFEPALFVKLTDAYAAGDRVGFNVALTELCGVLNHTFAQESTRDLHALPEQEREAFRSKPVNPQTWTRLHSRSRWRTAHSHSHRCSGVVLRHGRHGRQTRHVRRRRVASSRRLARAPGPREPEPPLAHSRGGRR
jgi:hypothetical protein